MKFPPFDYAAPSTIDEAVELLNNRSIESKILAGGQSLLPLLAFRLARPELLIDLQAIPTLSEYRRTDMGFQVGAMTRHRTLELDLELTNACPMLAEALSVLGHVAIRNAGTVGGSLAHADPAAEWPVLSVVLDAKMEIAGPKTLRTVNADAFFSGWFETAIGDDEILVRTTFNLPPPGHGSAFEEVARRHGDFAISGVAAVIETYGTTITDARIGLAGAAPIPIRIPEAERCLVGQTLSKNVLELVGEAARHAGDPSPDAHATIEYKRHLAQVLTKRAVSRAFARSISQTVSPQ
jgi:carbon-monoxide dehydrogenase medium subunit